MYDNHIDSDSLYMEELFKTLFKVAKVEIAFER